MQEGDRDRGGATAGDRCGLESGGIVVVVADQLELRDRSPGPVDRHIYRTPFAFAILRHKPPQFPGTANTPAKVLIPAPC